MLCGGLQKKNLSAHHDLYFMPPASVPPVDSPTVGRFTYRRQVNRQTSGTKILIPAYRLPGRQGRQVHNVTRHKVLCIFVGGSLFYVLYFCPFFNHFLRSNMSSQYLS